MNRKPENSLYLFLDSSTFTPLCQGGVFILIPIKLFTMTKRTFSELEFCFMYIETEHGEIYGLFSEYRLDPAILPENLIPYGIRYSDNDDSVPATIETFVSVNRFGVFITDKPLDFHGKDHIRIIEWGLDIDPGDVFI